MANLNHSMCVLCCHKVIDNLFQQTVNDNPTLLKWFSKLKNGKFDTKDKPGLSPPPELCSECLVIMIKVGDKREEVDKVEEQVRCLQQQLLRMLRHLGSLVKDYLEEMKGIEGKMRGSEENQVKIKEERAGIEHEEVLNNALAFRGQILAGIQELRQFYPILSSKLITATADVDPEFEETEVKIEMEDNLETTDFVEDDPPPFSDSPQGYQTEEEIKLQSFQEETPETEVGSKRPKRRAAASATKKTQFKAKRPAKVTMKQEPPEERSSSSSSQKAKAKAPVKRIFPKNYVPGWITCKRYKLHNAPRGTQRRKHYICQSCPNKIFQRTYGFEQHLRFHEAQCSTNTEKYSCYHCPLSFSLEQLYHFHVCCHEGVIKAVCDTCNKSQLAFDLERHLKEDHEILKPIQCPNCFNFSSNRDKFLNHLKYHLGKDALYPCDLCPVTFHTRKELLKHLQKEHQVLEPISCGIGNCTRTFLDKNSQNAHHISHTTRFACLICDKTCTSDVTLQKHLKRHEEKRWTCEHCGKKMTSKEVLEYHLKIHVDGNKPVTPYYQCHLCEKGFVRQSSFQEHIDWHNGRVHKCEQCGTLFPHRYILRRHLASHANPNPGKSFVCHVCGSGYKRIQHLRVHLKTHFEQKKFECEHCTKRFMRKEQLKQHLRVHSGEKPYVCEICGKAFNQAGSLWHHKKLVHPQSQADSASLATN